MYISLRRAFMLKKSLVFGSIVLLLGILLAFTGCDNPAGPAGPKGPQGDPGTPGTPGLPGGGNNNGEDDGDDNGGGDEILVPPQGAYVLDCDPTTGEVTAEQLAAAFAEDSKIVFARNVTNPGVIGTIDGVVPEGCALYVAGEQFIVAPNKRLTVLGDLIVWNGTIFDVSGTKETAAVTGPPAYPKVEDVGLLSGGGKITVRDGGLLLLPYDPTDILDEVVVTWESDFVADVPAHKKAIGSVINYPDNGQTTALNKAATIEALFTIYGLDKISAYNIPDLGSNPVPGSDTNELTLIGPGNKLLATTTTLQPYGDLIIAGTLTTQAAAGTKIDPENISILKDGVLALAIATDKFEGVEMADGANEGKITTAVTGAGSGLALETMLKGINGEIVASAALTHAANFTVPKGVSLTISGAVTNFTPADVDVKGKLTIGAGLDFKPTGNVTIVDPGTGEGNANNGVLVLETATTKLNIANSKTLWIQNPAKISGAGLILANGLTAAAVDNGTIDIGIEPSSDPLAPLTRGRGYTAPTANSVVAGKIAAAVADFDKTYNDVLKLGATGGVTLGTTATDYTTESILGVGTVTITADDTPTDVINGTSIATLPSTIILAGGAAVAPTGVGTGGTPGGAGAGDFTLNKRPFTDNLAITDTSFGTTPTPVKIALKFTTVKFEHNSKLISPAWPFNIGVITSR
jgi:hypothetical protein